ncbi:hypothetical protein H0H92_001236, partial [Tricholoma furcatifolium]
MEDVVTGDVEKEIREAGAVVELTGIDTRPSHEDAQDISNSNDDETLTTVTHTTEPSQEISMADPHTSSLRDTQDNEASNDNETLTRDTTPNMVSEEAIMVNSDPQYHHEDSQEEVTTNDDRTLNVAVLPTGQSRTPSQGKDRARPPRKRARRIRYDANDPRRFLDMEAEVSNDEEDDDNENAGLEDFINDASSESDEDAPLPMVHSNDSMRLDEMDLGMYGSEDEWGSEEGMLDWYDDPATTSHNSVMELMSTEEANQAWHFYLDEERRQAELEAQDRERYPDDRHWYPDPVPDTVPQELIPNSIVPLLPRPSVEKHMWHVAVKRGREEALAFTLYYKALGGSYKVKSVVGRVSCPGWIYVEAKNLLDVQQLCEEVRDIHIRKIFQVPHEQAHSVLVETPFSYSKPGDW